MWKVPRKLRDCCCGFAFAVVFIPLLQPVQAQRPSIKFKEELWEIGVLQEGEKVSHTFEFINAGNAPLRVFDAWADCGCTSVVANATAIPPGKAGTLRVTFDSRGKPGKQSKHAYIATNDPTDPQKSVELRVFVEDFHRQAGPDFKPEKIFSTACVTCHGERAKGKTGETLFVSVCATCHKAGSKTSALDQAYLAAHPAAGLRPKIADGTAKMPGFAKNRGGPLTEGQIESLITYLLSVERRK